MRSHWQTKRYKTMKIWTQEDVDALVPDEYGRRHYPAGTNFEDGCYFGTGSYFAEWCCFGRGCSFETGCTFGEDCKFNKGGCFFDSWCSFCRSCFFGEGCSFGLRCYFSKGCSFGSCTFGSTCAFSEGCHFSKECRFEGSKLEWIGETPFIALEGYGSSNRKTHFWMFESGIMVRSGCFYGTLQEFRKAARKKHGKDHVYLKFSDLVESEWSSLTKTGEK